MPPAPRPSAASRRPEPERQLNRDLPRRLFAEGLGTLLLVATVVGSGIMAEQLAGPNLGLALLGNTVATGAILFVLITVLGPVSGAHMNPAVSLIFAVKRELSWRELAGYATCQTAGGMAGTLLAHAMFARPLLQVSERTRDGGAQALSEAVATFALVLTILGARRVRPSAIPAAVALVIVAGYWFTASTSFANPAVTVARTMSNTFSGIAPASAGWFIAAQLMGALVAWLAADRVLWPVRGRAT
jgi:glycerol uptake facilitator-like aquaporin